MTIDAKITVRAASSIFRIKGKPQNIVSDKAEVRSLRYGGRLFFCPELHFKAILDPFFSQKTAGFWAAKMEGRNCSKGAETKEKALNSLAFRLKFYYNKSLYNVVGPWLMQGVAKLRKVAEVIRTKFNYLKPPHIAFSKGTIVAI